MIELIAYCRRQKCTFDSVKFYATILLLPLLNLVSLANNPHAIEPSGVDRILKKSNEKSHFEKNIGQWNEELKGVAHANNLVARFYDDKISFLLKSDDQEDVLVYNMLLENQLPDAQLDFAFQKIGKKNYLGCVENVPLFEEVRYINVYPNIDLRFYINARNEMEFDFLRIGF